MRDTLESAADMTSARVASSTATAADASSSRRRHCQRRSPPAAMRTMLLGVSLVLALSAQQGAHGDSRERCSCRAYSTWTHARLRGLIVPLALYSARSEYDNDSTSDDGTANAHARSDHRSANTGAGSNIGCANSDSDASTESEPNGDASTDPHAGTDVDTCAVERKLD